ncbi:hypothetical protein D9611_002141 [Ephemerocybe angulata]|uniref:F-box domain-containing protein n=1 Tax=Ephemerocybe angulata TaxID=980116 RepID=A0A8H5CJA2_9AGAR|nr:hypothetical protein D9611_002141 [Tulosesus angulatus]
MSNTATVMAQLQPPAVQSLIPEIVLAIVKIALEDVEDVHLFPWPRYRDKIRPELNRLRRISRHWNDVITGCPTLWKDVRMDLRRKDTTPPLEAEYNRFRLCVGRCNNLPRNLHLISPGAEGCGFESPDDEDDFDVGDGSGYVERPGLVQLILSSAKWRDVHVVLQFYVTFAWDILCQTTYKHKTWEWLEVLTLESEEIGLLGGESSIDCKPIVLVPENFPKLTEVTLNFSEYSLKPWNLLWGQLTKLTLQNFVDPFRTYLDILGQCKVLEEFQLTVGRACWLWFEEPVEQSPLTIMITLPYLRKLSLKINVASDVVEEFINRLTLPALERFTLAFRQSSGRHTNGQDPFISPLLDLVRRSRCSLLHLSLESLEVDEALFSQLLVSSPSLQCLLFAGARTSLNFLDSISSISHPAFQRIEITNRGCDPDEEVINRFTKWVNCWVKGAGLDDEDVLSRRKEVISALYQHVDTLKDIGGTVLVHGGVFPEPMGIEELKEEGWNVDVVYWAPSGW